jgi:hypothetical protein
MLMLLIFVTRYKFIQENMKSLTIFIFSAILFCWSSQSRAETPANGPSLDSAQTFEIARVLLTRLDEINAISKSGLSTAETRKLRRELRGIKGDLKELDGGTYLPVGTLLIILLVPFVVFSVSE